MVATRSIDEGQGRGRAAARTRVPPHNVEAEESVLGAMLLSPEVASQVMDKLHPEDFYMPANQAVFESCRRLFDSNQPIDAVTVADLLRRSGELDRIGGLGFLTGLVDAVPATSNVEYYAAIVEEHALRRSLIRAGSTAADLGFHIDEEVADVLDRAEQEVLGVAERRVGEGMVPVGPMFQAALERIEELESAGSEITGLATGFRDLDRKLAGLQAANLVVIAARPSMGKSALTLNIATNVAQRGEVVAIFSLEMSKEEIVQRILCSVGRIDSMKLRTGQLGNMWQRVVDAASRMYRAPIYIDDSPVVTVTDIRAKSRRLRRQYGLSLVVVDYMQLMQAQNRENRQQEIAEISRNLKNLARELDVPIIAVSQLNRSLEAREDKRPRLSDLRESGCLTGETVLVRADTNERVTIGELARLGGRGIPVWTLDAKLRLVPGTLSRAFSSGTKPVYRLVFASGRSIRASANHPFLTVDGWRAVDQLHVGDHLAAARRVPEPDEVGYMDKDRLVLLAHLIGGGCHLPRHELQYTTTDPENLEAVVKAASRAFDVRVRVRRKRRWMQVYFSSMAHRRFPRGRNPISAWLDQLGLYGQRSWRKFIPDPVFRLSNEQIALFLRHLWATDGCIHMRDRGVTIYYGTTSGHLARDVADLLLRIGITARVRRVDSDRYRPGYKVAVSGRADQLRFLRLVGCHGLRGRIGVAAERKLEGLASNPLDDARLDDLATSDVFWDRLVGIEPQEEEEEVFDATVPGNHNFMANGMIAHNSIEQDSDVVMFIYRHEYYHPEDEEKKGMAEVLVAKHRAGATGLVEMTFLPEFTRFADLGRDVTG